MNQEIFFSIKNEGYEKDEEMAEKSDVDPADSDIGERTASHRYKEPRGRLRQGKL